MVTATTGWVRSYEDELGLEYIENFGGVDWFGAPRPRRWHRCRPQTRGWVLGGYVERCACGAIRLGADGPWTERNRRR